VNVSGVNHPPAEPIIWHGDGKTWRPDLNSPSFDGNAFLSGIVVPSSTDAWAVGAAGSRALIEHYSCPA
jgi:hypothetical protein